MSTLLNKIFGTLDVESKDVFKQLRELHDNQFLKVNQPASDEVVGAQIATDALVDASLSKNTIQVMDKVEFSSIIPAHVSDFSIDKEYNVICKIDSVHQTLVNKGVDFSNIKNTLDVLSADLYSTENTAENSLWGSIAKEHNLPHIRSVTAGIHPEIYHTFAGYKNCKFGGMGDAHLYPTDFFNKWIESGSIIQYPKQTGGHVPREIMYGKEVGQRVDKAMFNYHLKHNKLVTGKYGGKLSGALYVFFAVGIILGRYEIVNWREEQRQRLKYGLRVLDEQSNLTTTQEEVREQHAKWLQEYYEDDEEEEEESEEDEE